MPSAFALLRHRSFAMLWAASFVSNVGTWMESVALGSYVTESTGQDVWAAVIAAAAFVPFTFSLVGGVLADRFSRRLMVTIGVSVQTALAATIAVLIGVGHPHPLVVAAIMFGSSTAGAIAFPAYQAMIPDLVPREDLVAAIGFGSASYNLGRVIGPALAGVIIAVTDVSGALFFNAVSFLGILAAVTAIRLPGRTATAQGFGLVGLIAEGIRFVRRDPGLSVMFRTMFVFAFLASPFIALIPAMAINELKGGHTLTAVLVTAQGVGAVAAGLCVGELAKRYGTRAVLVRAMVLLAVCIVAYGAIPGRIGVTAALVPLGAVYLVCLTSFSSIAQQRAPAELRGRVLSINMLILGVVYPVGGLLQGVLADAVGLRTVTVASGALLGSILLAIHVMRPGITDPIEEPVSVPAAAG